MAGDGPTLIMVNSMIRSISKIDDYKMVSMGACTNWRDKGMHKLERQGHAHIRVVGLKILG